MARIRSIKPEFFFDYELAQIPPLMRIFYIGLWVCADRQGKIAHECAKLKACILPYEDIDVQVCLNTLKKFVLQYEVNGKKYLKINNFLKHQRPHHTEQPSSIPEPKVLKRCRNGVDTVLTREEKGKVVGKDIKDTWLDKFENIWQTYPNKLGKDRAFKSFSLTVKSDEDFKKIVAALGNYAAYIAKNKIESRFIKHGSTWFHQWRDWVDYKEPIAVERKFRTADEVLASREERSKQEEMKNAGNE